MLDDLDRLRAKNTLYQLLVHYEQLAVPDRAAWQDRLMAMDGVETPDIAKLHGELIALGWIEQNTGNSPSMRAGIVPACYRATLAGIRAVQQIQAPESIEVDEESAPLAEQKSIVHRLKRKREKKQEPELVASHA